MFTKEIQAALLAGEVDLAVHSLKDLPTQTVAGLTLAAVPPRENLGGRADRDDRRASLDDLPPGARVGTGSLRRRAQLLHLRPDLTMLDIRGNVDTRLRKLDDGEYDAIVLAAAGLTRLGWADRITEMLDAAADAAGAGARRAGDRVPRGRRGHVAPALRRSTTRRRGWPSTAERARAGRAARRLLGAGRRLGPRRAMASCGSTRWWPTLDGREVLRAAARSSCRRSDADAAPRNSAATSPTTLLGQGAAS